MGGYAPPGKGGFPPQVAKTQEDGMRFTVERMEIINEYETLQKRESEILDCLDWMRLSLAERNALEYSLEFASEEGDALRGEYLTVLWGKVQ
jgi:hypothetical protein